MTGLLLGVETDDYDDIEIGCSVYSTTHQDPVGMIGGCVLEVVDEPVRAAKVFRWCSPSGGPVTAVIPFTDIEIGNVTFDTMNAERAATAIDGWLTRLKDRQQRERANASEWRAIAAMLYDIRDRGMYTPKAEARYQERFKAKWAAINAQITTKPLAD